MTDRVSGSRAVQLPINSAAVEARSDMEHVLAAWSGLVVDERRITGPGSRRVRNLAAFLLVHLDWLAGHAAVADLVAEIARVAAAGRTAAYPDPLLGLDLGTCGHADCDSTIFATLHPEDMALPRHLRCEAGHAWPPHQWALLARRIREARNSPTPTSGPRSTVDTDAGPR